MTRRRAFVVVAAILGGIVSLLLAEGVARLYVYGVAERGKLFEPDARVGWKNRAHLDLRRRNADGVHWRIRTNSRGERFDGESFDASAPRRILVIGDSFAFGEGVELRDRFDTRIAARHPEWSFVNQGVMGYGTDQQLLAARERLAELREGDVLVLVTHLNDFVDLLRHSHSGRRKPWFELVEGELVLHMPEISLATRLRDQSYLLARFFQEMAEDPVDLPAERVRQAGHLYRRIVLDETAELRARGVRLLIAHHGLPLLGRASPGPLEREALVALSRVCSEPELTCISLDERLAASAGAGLFQSDGHWNADGNAAAAEALREALERLDAAQQISSRSPRTRRFGSA